jgi:3-oxoadipate enol-lactonase
MQQSFAASDGIRIAYMIDDFTDPWCQPPTLLLLHAAMGSSKRWYAAVPPLCRDYRVVRMDLRGHGESQVPPPEPPLSMDRLVQDVRELLDHLGCRRQLRRWLHCAEPGDAITRAPAEPDAVRFHAWIEE